MSIVIVVIIINMNFLYPTVKDIVPTTTNIVNDI